MIFGGDLKKGSNIRLDGVLYRVLKVQYHKPGRGNAYMQTTVMDIATSKESSRVFNADERLEDIYVEGIDVEYLYRDGEMLTFMNKSTYEQYEASASLFGDDVLYLRDNMTLELKVYEGKPIDYQLPTTVQYKVVETEMAVAGNTAGNVTKRVKVDTGLSVQVPMFVNEGDLIKIDTRDGSYLGRNA